MSNRSSRNRAKRKRRTDKQVVKHGRSAKRGHRRRGGRTGQIQEKSTAPKHRARGVVTSTPLTAPLSVLLLSGQAERKGPAARSLSQAAGRLGR